MGTDATMASMFSLSFGIHLERGGLDRGHAPRLPKPPRLAFSDNTLRRIPASRTRSAFLGASLRSPGRASDNIQGALGLQQVACGHSGRALSGLCHRTGCPGMVRDLCSRVRAQITHHPSFAVALTGGAALRMLPVLGYPGALWFSDSFIYLGVALRPEPDPASAVGYSVFLRALEPFHILALVTGLQHLMGLGIAGMIYAVARRSAVPRGWA